MIDKRNLEVKEGDWILVYESWGKTLKEGIFRSYDEEETRVRYLNPDTGRINSVLLGRGRIYKLPARGL